jgi:ribosomal-protein-alanine N-acetyltransferase
MIVLETPRLVLRRLTRDDVDALAAIYRDPEVMRFFPKTLTREETAEQVDRIVRSYEERGYGLWATILKEDNRLIGRSGLLMQEIEGEPMLEVAYLLDRAVWRRGLGTEVARAISDFAAARYRPPRLVSLVHPDNVASQRVAERNGMRHERDVVFRGLLHRLYVINSPSPPGRISIVPPPA